MATQTQPSFNSLAPASTMHTHLDNRYGTPDPKGHGTKLDHPLGLDAVDTLKAVQGIIDSYLANGGAADGRSAVPTPEPSPGRRFAGNGKRDVVDVNGGQGTALREDAGLLGGTEVANGTLKATANGTPSNNDNGIGNSTKPPPAPAVNGLDQDRLQYLADDITRNISQMATDDAARIKTATAALELAAAVRPPGDTIMGWFANMSVISAVRLFLHWGAFDIIPQGKGESITYAELAAHINADEALLTRIASMLTSARVLTHHPPAPSPTHSNPSSSASLSHTPTSLLLLPARPHSAMFTLLYSQVTHVSTILPSYFDAYGRTEPTGPAHIPTSFLAGQPEQDFFSLLKRDEAALANFGIAMRMSSGRVPVTGVYDMGRVLRLAGGRETVWVDVGGGDGHTVGEFLRVYGGEGGLRAGQCVVQDLEEVVRAAAEREGEGEGVLRGVRWVGLDFLREAPVEGALIYYLRHIVRDYSDPVTTTILRNISHAMTDPDARVLISEQLNPDVASMAGPLPLYAAFKDFSMLSIGGKERSLQQFAAVADAAGLRVSGVFQHEATAHAVVELALKEGREGA